jgi:hypothetical protein
MVELCDGLDRLPASMIPASEIHPTADSSDFSTLLNGDDRNFVFEGPLFDR